MAGDRTRPVHIGVPAQAKAEEYQVCKMFASFQIIDLSE